MFISSRNAYADLPPELKTRIEGLSANQVFTGQYGEGVGRGEKIPDSSIQSIHPLVYTNPRTGDPVLFLSQLWTHSIVGYPDQESMALLDELEAILYRPDCVYRHSWDPHDLVVWDNISVQHAREPVELGGPPRRLRRVTIGDPTRYLEESKG
jgi:taurine dioxygenase